MYDAKLGPLRFPTLLNDVAESVGEQLEAVGAAVLAAERRARPFKLELPVYAEASEADPQAFGERLRRQVRALMENGPAKLEGLYLAFDLDPELNGWLLVGSGELAYTDGGISFADFKLTLDDCYRVATQRTHRTARRVAAIDRRLSTSPRDVTGRLFSTAFGSYAPGSGVPAPALALPPGVTEIRRGTTVEPNLRTRDTLDGTLTFVPDAVDQEVIHFEIDEDDLGRGGVRVFDRQGVIAPTFTAAGDLDPEDEYGWEQIYGPDQPLTDGDAPVLDNGLCRVRWLAANDCFVWETYSAGAYVERGRFGILSMTGVERAFVQEWTPERAVVQLRTESSDIAETVWLILQRGWDGPVVEMWGTNAVEQIEIVPDWTDTPVLFAPRAAASVGGVRPFDDPSASWSGSVNADGTLTEPWVAMGDVAGARDLILMTLVQQLAVDLVSNSGFYGSLRRGVRLTGQSIFGSLPGYAERNFTSVRLGWMPSAWGKVYEAEAYTLGGSASLVTDANAAPSGGSNNAIETTSTTTNAVAITDTKGAGAAGPADVPAGVYEVWARVRTVDAGATLSVRAATTVGSGSPDNTGTRTYGSQSHGWVYLGDIDLLPNLTAFQIQLWRSAGTGAVRLDRYALAARSVSGRGIADSAEETMWDLRGVPELVSR
jgi:hypothetical protein